MGAQHLATLSEWALETYDTCTEKEEEEVKKKKEEEEEMEDVHHGGSDKVKDMKQTVSRNLI